MRQMILDFRSFQDKLRIFDSLLQAYMERILTAFGNPIDSTTENHTKSAVVSIQNSKLVLEGSKIQNLLEPHSDRELELLHLMAAGLSTQEIADRLIITIGTVKSHANHIFGKLGVQGRVKAINRARALGLISEI